jgi:undecaprenyl-phosphate galactose phosphotransferase/putative colanic acid biosynthesis UDP-glucose lipid carrier transferase
MALLAGSDAQAIAYRLGMTRTHSLSAHNAHKQSLSLDPQIESGQNDNRRDERQPAFHLACSSLGHAFATVDAVTVLLASVLGAKGYEFLISGAPWNLHFHVGAGAAGALVYVLIGRSSGYYQVSGLLSSSRRDSTDALWHWLLTSLSLALVAFLFKIGVDFSRGAIFSFFGVAFVLLFSTRSLMKRTLLWAVRAGRVHGQRIVLVGLRDELAVISPIDLLRRFGLTEIARVALPNNGNWSSVANNGVLASLNDSLVVARERDAEEIVLALNWNDTRSIDLIRERLRSSPLPVQLLPDSKVRYLTNHPAFSVGRSLSIEIQRAPLTDLERRAKRVFDIVGALIALLLLAPLMLVTALLIKLDSPGPVLFRQQRSGFNAKRFHIFKFRTMSVMEDGAAVSQATRNDPRVTKFGRILRATSVDELPQLFNVLLGDMSLVGPRPHALAHDDEYSRVIADYAYRHHVKPGITGWAQIHGCRGETAQVESMQRRLDLDLWYIGNWQWWLDVVILFRTVIEVLRHRNAY